MATPNITARNNRATEFKTAYATGTLTIKAGATTLATHNLAGFGVATAGAVTANAIADTTNLASGTADSAVLSAGTENYTLTVGLSGSGAEVILTKLGYVLGGTSQISGLTISY